MKTSTTILFVILAAALALPGAAFAAKGEPKNKKSQSPEETFATIDQNKDGVVTQAEYLAVMKRVFWRGWREGAVCRVGQEQ